MFLFALKLQNCFKINIISKNTYNFTSVNCTFIKTEILAVLNFLNNFHCKLLAAERPAEIRGTPNLVHGSIDEAA